MEIIDRVTARSRGLSRFYTAKPCKRGHDSQRYVKNNGCVACELLRERERNAADPSVRAAICKRHYDANADKRRAARRRSYQSERERPGFLEAAVQRTKAWARANPEARAAQCNLRRARKLLAEGSYTAEDVARIRAGQRDRCAYCRRPLAGAGDVDHIVALASGGSNWPRNLQLLCHPCNSAKSARDPVDFARSTGRLL